MAKRTITFSLDVEASGPIPGPWWMCSFGVCRTDDPAIGIKRVLQPLVIDGFSEPDSPDAMRVVAKGVPEVSWNEDAPPEENVAVVRRYFEEHGEAPADALADLDRFLRDQAGSDRTVIIGSPVTFDFMWMYWYWWRFRDEMPVFGYSGLDVRSYFMGMHGVGFLGTGKERYLRHYPNEFAHTHDPLDDARQQGAIWRDMTAARLARKAQEKKARPSKD
ncbi:MAG: hypothetical protein CMJ83_18290 [Planctomycetes bacterium]|nr:hypothetical protein [Planctomycetota bacterium]